jgi:uncharacterized protein (DUF488 family)
MMLMTIGYEGLDIGTFIAELKANRVATLVDVRELPLSRKKNFSKSALADAVQGAGIAYVHMSALGCPRDIRKEYAADGDWGRYRKRFDAYLETQDDALAALRATARRESCCLMCFEADYRVCHRSLITDALVRDGEVEVKHLTVRKPSPDGSA